jgi:tetratricopeptide (TPR) repeat protein
MPSPRAPPIPATTRNESFNSPLYSRALERYQLAQLLQELGRGEAALPWLESMAQVSPYELVFLAPSHLRRAEIYESLNRPADAAAQYTRFIELWKDADPESQPLVAQARVRLAAVAHLSSR